MESGEVRILKDGADVGVRILEIWKSGQLTRCFNEIWLPEYSFLLIFDVLFCISAYYEKIFYQFDNHCISFGEFDCTVGFQARIYH